MMAAVGVHDCCHHLSPPLRLITEWRREMMAAVVDPVGRNANWSANCSVGGGDNAV